LLVLPVILLLLQVLAALPRRRVAPAAAVARPRLATAPAWPFFIARCSATQV
jgi:hypothetical protein